MEVVPDSQMEVVPDSIAVDSEMVPDSIIAQDSIEMVPDSLPLGAFVCGCCGLVHEDRPSLSNVSSFM
jgi:hypothetical protein